MVVSNSGSSEFVQSMCYRICVALTCNLDLEGKIILIQADSLRNQRAADIAEREDSRRKGDSQHLFAGGE